MAAVGFRDRLRFMNVLLHSMTTFREFQLKQVQAVSATTPRCHVYGGVVVTTP